MFYKNFNTAYRYFDFIFLYVLLMQIYYQKEDVEM